METNLDCTAGFAQCLGGCLAESAATADDVVTARVAGNGDVAGAVLAGDGEVELGVLADIALEGEAAGAGEGGRFGCGRGNGSAAAVVGVAGDAGALRVHEVFEALQVTVDPCLEAGFVVAVDHVVFGDIVNEKAFGEDCGDVAGAGDDGPAVLLDTAVDAAQLAYQLRLYLLGQDG